MRIKANGRLAGALAVATGLAMAPPASAHHSFAMYDNDHQVKLMGTVTHFQWTNPHVYIELENNDTAAKVARWTIECANPGILDRVGWKFNMIKPGDKLTVIVALPAGASSPPACWPLAPAHCCWPSHPPIRRRPSTPATSTAPGTARRRRPPTRAWIQPSAPSRSA